MLNYILLICIGLSYGFLSSAGVFTVLVAVGLIPRFANKTHTSRYVILYEEMVISGTIFGCIISVFNEYCQLGGYLQNRFPSLTAFWTGAGNVMTGIFGLFCGMFIGCLALAIAEMLDSIPIFTRRVSLRHGIGVVILAVAAGKLAGSLYYFILELHRTV